MWGDLNLEKNGSLCHHTHHACDNSCCFMNYLMPSSFFFGIFLCNPHLCDAGVLLKPQFLCGFNNKVIYITLKAREVIHVDYLTDLPKNGFSVGNFTEISWVDLFHGNGREKFRQEENVFYAFYGLVFWRLVQSPVNLFPTKKFTKMVTQ